MNLAVLTFLLSKAERDRAPAIRHQLIATLFGSASNVMMVALAALVCGGTAFFRNGSWLTATIAGGEVAMLLARCWVILAFQKAERCEGRPIDIDGWLISFSILAIASSLSWGALCFVCLAFSNDPLLYVIPVLSTVGTAGAIAARNSGVPRLAKIQLAASLTPILAGCLYADDAGYRLLLILVPAMAAGLVILIDERNQQLVDLIETQNKLALLSTTDALTALPNRRCFDTRLAEMLKRGAEGYPFALLMIDVDNFKLFNDRHGHLAGDALLQQIAAVLQLQISIEEGLVARYGGEEFAILFDGANIHRAAMLGEGLKHAISESCPKSAGRITTVSVGVVAWRRSMTRDDLFNAADEALYRAKRAGRNRVEIAAPRDLAA